MPIYKALSLCCVVCCLAGCATQPETLGISQQQWRKYDQQKQQQILADHKHLTALAAPEIDVPTANPWLKVAIHDGLVMMPPFSARYKYIPTSFRIQQGTCQNVLLHTYHNTNHIMLTACYKKNILWLDSSRYEIDKKYGSVRLYSSPLWIKGFTYNNLNSSGYARLHNVTVTVHKL